MIAQKLKLREVADNNGINIIRPITFSSLEKLSY